MSSSRDGIVSAEGRTCCLYRALFCAGLGLDAPFCRARSLSSSVVAGSFRAARCLRDAVGFFGAGGAGVRRLRGAAGFFGAGGAGVRRLRGLRGVCCVGAVVRGRAAGLDAPTVPNSLSPLANRASSTKEWSFKYFWTILSDRSFLNL